MVVMCAHLEIYPISVDFVWFGFSFVWCCRYCRCLSFVGWNVSVRKGCLSPSFIMVC